MHNPSVLNAGIYTHHTLIHKQSGVHTRGQGACWPALDMPSTLPHCRSSGSLPGAQLREILVFHITWRAPLWGSGLAPGTPKDHGPDVRDISKLSMWTVLCRNQITSSNDIPFNSLTGNTETWRRGASAKARKPASKWITHQNPHSPHPGPSPLTLPVPV